MTLRKYFLKNNLTKSSQESTELTVKPCIQCFTESFKANGISFCTTSTEILGKHIMEHTLNFPENKYASSYNEGSAQMSHWAED